MAEVNKLKEILETIEKKPMPILIIFSIVILPSIIKGWISLFPQHLVCTTIITTIIIIVWICAICYQWQEIKAWRRKTRLVSYLKRHGPYRSFHHLATEWEAKDDYSIKIIKNLIKRYPDDLNDTPMRGNMPGVGLNINTKKKNRIRNKLKQQKVSK